MERAPPSRPRMRYRLLWTWDHSTNWDLSQPGQQEEGCFNPYLKPADAFLSDYRRAIDHMSRLNLNGLIVWGFLRDSHGGVRAAQRLCRYAAARNVRIIAGVGVMAYGGVYYEGRNEYCMEEWLREHPELSALDENGEAYGCQPNPGGPRMRALCPSKEENVEWLIAGVEWLVENFEIGGINYESGDYSVCHCQDCRGKASGINVLCPNSEAASINVSFDLMREIYPPLMDRVHEIRTDIWQTFSPYCGYRRDWAKALGHLLDPIPDYAICQWTLTHMLAGTEGFGWEDDLRFPAKHNIGYFHQGSQWCDYVKDGRPQGRYNTIVETLKMAAQKGLNSGLEGLALHGEVSAEHASWAINYDAFSRLCQDPTIPLTELTAAREGV